MYLVLHYLVIHRLSLVVLIVQTVFIQTLRLLKLHNITLFWEMSLRRKVFNNIRVLVFVSN